MRYRSYLTRPGNTRLVALFVGIILTYLICEPAQGESMVFTEEADGGNHCCFWIQAEGEITAKTPSDWRYFIAQGRMASGHKVVFHSQGGDLHAAMELGRLLREAHVFTVIGKTVRDISSNHWPMEEGTCASACVWAYLGGERRALSDPNFRVPAGRLFVHRFGSAAANTSVAAAQMMAGIVTGYVTEMGGDPRLVTIASSTPVNELRELTAEEIKKYKIVTLNGQSGGWTWTRVGNGIALDSSGYANSEYHHEFQYKIRIVCESSASQNMTIFIVIQEHNDIPEGIVNNGVDNFCDQFDVNFGEPQSVNCLRSDDRKVNIMTIRRVTRHTNFLLIEAGLGKDGIAFIDGQQKLSIRIDPTSMSMHGHLPEEIVLPWDGRRGATSILRRSCWQ